MEAKKIKTVENKDRLRHPESGLPKFYNPSEHLAVDKVIVKFQVRVIFRQYIPKKRNVSASKFPNSERNMGIRMT
jgi:hypothetical protein